MPDKKYIFDLNHSDLLTEVKKMGELDYRADQLWEGLYQHLWGSPIEFTNISKKLQGEFEEYFLFSHLKESTKLHSKDGKTIKKLFKLPDGNVIETVLMIYEKRRTLCISTQSGCALGCVFCATGQMGFYRNLSSGEIVEQVIHFAKELKFANDKITNIVLMGMGEPFHNYEESLDAIRRLNDPSGFKFGARRFTISTVGLVPEILRFAKEETQINLAVSLHSVDDELRSSMLPINKKYPVKELLNACREYTNITKRRITFEWALIDNVNDSPEHARNLGNMIQDMNCHVNIIPLNPTKEYTGKRSQDDQINTFVNTLSSYGIPTTLRVRRGIDIHAGCGQLAKENQ